MTKKIVVLKCHNEIENVDLVVDIVQYVTDKLGFKNFVISPTTSIDEIVKVLKASDGVIVGDIPNKELIYKIKKAFCLYANIKRYKTLDNVVDVVVVKEQLSGLYHGEHGIRHGELGREAYDTKTYSAVEIERVLRVGFEMAEKRNHKLVLADMPNTETGRLFRSVAAELIDDYPSVEYKAISVNDCLKSVVTNPKQYDVIVTANLYGDMIMSVLDGIVDTKGMAANLSITRSAYAMCEEVIDPAYPKELSNPIPTLLSLAMFIRTSYDLDTEATRIESSISSALSVTKPINMVTETEKFSTAKDIIEQIKKAL